VVEDNKTQAGFDTFFVHDNNTKVTLRVYFGAGGMTLSNGLNRIWNSSCPVKKKRTHTHTQNVFRMNWLFRIRLIDLFSL